MHSSFATAGGGSGGDDQCRFYFQGSSQQDEGQ